MESYDKIDQHLIKDKVLAKAVISEAFPLRFMKGDLYAALLKSIVSQQLSLKSAATIHGRFLELFEDLYPHPELLLDFDEDTLRSVGVSRRKASYMQNVAQFHLDNNLQDEKWLQKSNQEIVDELTQIKGIGEWTVHMILMFNLCRPDVFPIGDLGVIQGMTKLYNLEESGKALKKKCTEIAETWRPYLSYASFYIWEWHGKN